jgi:hypothetical protein
METNKKAKDYAEKLINLVAKKSGLDISKYDMGELVQGMLVELEHGSHNEETNITNDDPEQTLKIAMAHLDELPDYYTRLIKMEKEAESVKTDTEAEDEEKENDEESEKEEKITMENVAQRFKELCGIVENENKKQLKNTLYQEKVSKKLLKEEIDPQKFDIVKFSNDGLGEKKTEEEIDLYRMERKKK